MLGRAGENVRSSGRECALERARMCARAGEDVGSSGRECRSSRRGRWVERARMCARAGENVPSSGRESTVERAMCARSTGRECALERTRMCARAGGSVRSSRRECAVERARTFLQSAWSTSTAHCRPVNPTFAPCQGKICARSRQHLRPVDATFAPGRRDESHVTPAQTRFLPAQGSGPSRPGVTGGSQSTGRHLVTRGPAWPRRAGRASSRRTRATGTAPPPPPRTRLPPGPHPRRPPA
jgi:hypothetical protein